MVSEIHGHNDFLLPGERWATPAEKQNFWTVQRTHLIKGIYLGVNRRFHEIFRGPPVPTFSTNNFFLTISEDKSLLIFSGSHHPQSGWIFLNITDLKDDRTLAEVVAHEIGESRAYRLSQFGPQYNFIDEAVIEITSQQLLYEINPYVKDDPKPVTYGKAREATEILCKQMFHALPTHFAYPHKVFYTLQNALFVNSPQDFINTFKLAYGETAFTILKQLGNFGRTVTDWDIINPLVGNDERFIWLKRFLSGEAVDLDSALAAIDQSAAAYSDFLNQPKPPSETPAQRILIPKETLTDGTNILIDRFLINEKLVEFDYTNIPVDIPLEYWLTPETKTKQPGVRNHIDNIMDNIYRHLRGEKTYKPGMLTVGEEPHAQGLYVPTQEAKMRRQVYNATYQLLCQALDVSPEPVHSFYRSKIKEKIEQIEIHVANFWATNSPDVRIYFIHMYNTRKKYNKEERKVLRDKAYVHTKVMTQNQLEEFIRSGDLWL